MVKAFLHQHTFHLSLIFLSLSTASCNVCLSLQALFVCHCLTLPFLLSVSIFLFLNIFILLPGSSPCVFPLLSSSLSISVSLGYSPCHYSCSHYGLLFLPSVSSTKAPGCHACLLCLKSPLSPTLSFIIIFFFDTTLEGKK